LLFCVQFQTSLDEATDPWGVKVERVEVYVHCISSLGSTLFVINLVYTCVSVKLLLKLSWLVLSWSQEALFL